MEISRVVPIIAATDFAAELAALSGVLGAPTFVDGERWAQFDPAGGRVCLAGASEGIARNALMLRTDDLEAAKAAAEQAGFSVSEPVEGPHETRLGATGPGGIELVFYRPAAG